MFDPSNPLSHPALDPNTPFSALTAGYVRALYENVTALQERKEIPPAAAPLIPGLLGILNGIAPLLGTPDAPSVDISLKDLQALGDSIREAMAVLAKQLTDERSKAAAERMRADSESQRADAEKGRADELAAEAPKLSEATISGALPQEIQRARLDLRQSWDALRGFAAQLKAREQELREFEQALEKQLDAAVLEQPSFNGKGEEKPVGPANNQNGASHTHPRAATSRELLSRIEVLASGKDLKVSAK